MQKASLTADFTQHTLKFKKPGGTSRGVLHEKRSWYLIVKQMEKTGIGECGPLKGLSIDNFDEMENKLNEVCLNINDHEYWLKEGLTDFPSIRFGLETALLDLRNGGSRILYPSEFTEGNDFIRINGLIWMGKPDFMLEQVEEKLQLGFHCIKIKIGAIDFEEEIRLLSYIRDHYSAKEIELRVDANGAFSPNEAFDRLERLAELDIHSIEQPIKQNQWNAMEELCRQTPVPIALDEEIIGIRTLEEKQKLLKAVQPQYIILKPSLVGGFKESEEWIEVAEENNTGWWITSALESNIGLNAIAQWTYTLNNPMPQGLGTGQVFSNNIPSPLYLEGEKLYFNKEAKWDLSPIL